MLLWIRLRHYIEYIGNKKDPKPKFERSNTFNIKSNDIGIFVFYGGYLKSLWHP